MFQRPDLGGGDSEDNVKNLYNTWYHHVVKNIEDVDTALRESSSCDIAHYSATGIELISMDRLIEMLQHCDKNALVIAVDSLCEMHLEEFTSSLYDEYENYCSKIIE